MATEVRRVLALRPDNLGDLVLFVGALRHIREHYVGAKITLCVKQYARDLVELCPYVDRLVSWEDLVCSLTGPPPLAWLPKIRGHYRFRRLVGRNMACVRKWRLSTDILLLPVRSPTRGPRGMHAIVEMIPARAKYGVAGDFCNQSQQDDRAADEIYTDRLWLAPERRQDHEFRTTSDFLRFLGIEVAPTDLWPEFWTDCADARWADDVVPSAPTGLVLAISPGKVSIAGALIPAATYSEALSLLADARLSVVLFGSTAEGGVCQQVARALADCETVVSVTNLAGRSTIRQLVEALRRCDGVLAQDTAALHIAVALRKPTVGILGGGHFGRFYPWGDPSINRVAHVPVDCYGCNWRCPYSTLRCIQSIAPAEIARQLALALGLSGSSIPPHRELAGDPPRQPNGAAT